MFEDALRPLGYWESQCARLHDEADGTGMIVAAVGFRTSVPTRRVVAALSSLQGTHPVLRATIAGRSGRYVFLATDRDVLPLTVDDEDEHPDWRTAVEDEANRPLDTHIRLWRARWLPASRGVSCLVLCIHHAIADGRSINRLLADFAALLGGWLDEWRYRMVDNVERLLRPTISWREFSRVQNGEAGDTRAAIPFEQPAASSRHRQLYGRCPVSALVLAGRRCGGGVLGLLAASMQAASGRVFGVPLPRFSVPVCLRPRLSVELERHLGCYTSVVALRQVDEEPARSLGGQARGLRMDIREQAESRGGLPLDFPVLGDWSAGGESFCRGLGVTSSGVVPLGKEAEAVGVEFVFVNAVRRFGDMALSLSARTVRGELFATLAYAVPLLSDATARRFAEEMRRGLLRLAPGSLWVWDC